MLDYYKYKFGGTIMIYIKRICIVILILIGFLSLAGCEIKTRPLMVASTSFGDSFIPGLSLQPSDQHINDLIHGYKTLVETKSGEYVWDTTAVLTGLPTITTDSTGNKTYTFELQNNLKWNTGDAITAKDYVANLLFRSSIDWGSIGGLANAGLYLLGYVDYRYGPYTLDSENRKVYDNAYTALNQPFLGVRLLSATKFSLTINHEHLPNFFEEVMVQTYPIPTNVYLPGFDVVDSPQGAKIIKVTNSEATSLKTTINDTINNSETGQRYRPTSTCGPYQFGSNDGEVVLLEINPFFKTTYDNLKPKIKNIQIKLMSQESIVNQIILGQVDLVSDVVIATTIAAARVAADKVSVSSYTRNGYGFLAMTCDFGPTKYKEVRQALGFLVDRNSLITQTLSGLGTYVDGPYGESQWFYKQSQPLIDSLLIQYTLNIDEANARLDLSPYQFEADGITPFDKTKVSSAAEYYRYNTQGEPLEIKHALQDSMFVNDFSLPPQLANNSWKVGIKYTMHPLDFNTMLNHYYYGSLLGEEREYHLFNQATTLPSNYNPYERWHSSLVGTTSNPSGLAEEELDAIMEAMQSTNPTAKETYKTLFVQFVVKWNELLPHLPLYSNEYFDMYTKDLKGLNTTPVWSWAKDICNLYFE